MTNRPASRRALLVAFGVCLATLAAGAQQNADPFADTSEVVSIEVPVHVVGEPYGFRLESGRSGPRGNDRFIRVLKQLERLDAKTPFDAILITGDLTDAGTAADRSRRSGASRCRRPALRGRNAGPRRSWPSRPCGPAVVRNARVQRGLLRSS